VTTADITELPRRWICVSSGAWAMKRLNLTFFVEFGAALRPLAATPGLSWDSDQSVRSDWRPICFEARRLLSQLVQEDGIPLAVPASRPAAQKLLTLIQIQSKTDQKDLRSSDQWAAYWLARPLLTLLHGELAVQSVYHIWPKRAFDTNLLIDKATALFSKEIQTWFTAEETYNIEQAGKCIALEVPTAAGFHLVRAAESVIRRYYAIVVGKEPAKKMRNWGVYIKGLQECGADPKIIHALDQIRDLHRNPVIHPEVTLTLEEAISLVGIIESIISAIYSDMKQREAAKISKNSLLSMVRSGGGILSAIEMPDEEIPF
jgi:hypothetical protein